MTLILTVKHPLICCFTESRRNRCKIWKIIFSNMPSKAELPEIFLQISCKCHNMRLNLSQTALETGTPTWWSFSSIFLWSYRFPPTGWLLWGVVTERCPSWIWLKFCTMTHQVWPSSACHWQFFKRGTSSSQIIPALFNQVYSLPRHWQNHSESSHWSFKRW